MKMWGVRGRKSVNTAAQGMLTDIALDMTGHAVGVTRSITLRQYTGQCRAAARSEVTEKWQVSA